MASASRKLPGYNQRMPPAYAPRTAHSHWDSGLWTRVFAASGTINPMTGAPFTEAMLAGLGGGIGFMLFTFEYTEVTTASVVMRFHPGPFVENMLSRSGAAVSIQQTGSARLAQARLDAALETGAPAVVRVVRGQLPWAEAEPWADMYSMDIAVVARDGDAYLVDDGGGRLERISAAALGEARGKRKADKHWQAHVLVDAGRDGGTALTPQVLRGAVAQTMEALLSDGAPPGIPAGYAKNFGLAGMRSWAAWLKDTSGKRGWARIFADPDRRAGAMSMLHRQLTGKRYSGPGALRPLYAQFLREAAPLADAGDGVVLSRWLEAAGEYAKLGAHWTWLAALIELDAGGDFAAMSETVAALADAEERTARLAMGTLMTGS